MGFEKTAKCAQGRTGKVTPAMESLHLSTTFFFNYSWKKKFFSDEHDHHEESFANDVLEDILDDEKDSSNPGENDQLDELNLEANMFESEDQQQEEDSGQEVDGSSIYEDITTFEDSTPFEEEENVWRLIKDLKLN